MEESPIMDTPSESKPPFLALGLGVVALVLGGVSLILTVRTKGTVAKIEKDSVATDTTALTKKVDDSNSGIITLREEFIAQRNANAVLQNKISTLESAYNTLARQYADFASGTSQRIANIERRGGGGTPAQPPARPVRENTPPVPPVGNTPVNNGVAGGLYSVVAGDNLTKIAHKHGITLSALEVANPGVDSAKLRVDQKIKIPAKDTARPPRPAQPRTGGAATPPAR